MTSATRKDLGYKIEDMLVSCHFNYQPCTFNNFTYFYHQIYGNCYSFNSGTDANGHDTDILNIDMPGVKYGLILELFLGNPSVDTAYEFDDGLIFSIDNQSFVPFLKEDLIKVSAHSETDLIISRTFINGLPNPYGDCLLDTSSSSSFNSSYFSYIVNTLGINYTEHFCYSLCMQQYIRL